MGLGADAELIFGLPVLAYDEENYEPTFAWEGEDWCWWSPLDATLTTRSYGHYEDPDNSRGILTLSKFPAFRADCWEPNPISWENLRMGDLYRKELWEAFEDEGITRDVEEWIAKTRMLPNYYLVASFG